MSGSGYLPHSIPEPPEDAAAFGRLLFNVARDHPDSEGHRLGWSEGFTGAYGPHDRAAREYGRKFGWGQPNDLGQPMVYVAVGGIPEADRPPCGTEDNAEPANCAAARMVNGSTATALSTPSRQDFHWSRPDGSHVFAIADSTFRNNSLVPSTAALPTLKELEEFATDSRLVPPARE